MEVPSSPTETQKSEHLSIIADIMLLSHKTDDLGKREEKESSTPDRVEETKVEHDEITANLTLSPHKTDDLGKREVTESSKPDRVDEAKVEHDEITGEIFPEPKEAGVDRPESISSAPLIDPWSGASSSHFSISNFSTTSLRESVLSLPESTSIDGDSAVISDPGCRSDKFANSQITDQNLAHPENQNVAQPRNLNAPQPENQNLARVQDWLGASRSSLTISNFSTASMRESLLSLPETTSIDGDSAVISDPGYRSDKFANSQLTDQNLAQSKNQNSAQLSENQNLAQPENQNLARVQDWLGFAKLALATDRGENEQVQVKLNSLKSQLTDDLTSQSTREKEQKISCNSVVLLRYQSPQTINVFPQKSQELQNYPYETLRLVESHDKSQQTDEFVSKIPQWKQLGPYNMYAAKKTKVIGPDGGTIELHKYKVYYPPNSLTEAKEIELSIDNNPCNFPKEGLPITSILNIKPSMKLEIPAIVTMPTSCVGSKGKVKVRILGKKNGRRWKKWQTASLADENKINFKTDQLPGSVVMSVSEKETNLEHIIANRLFIQKNTGTILTVFALDEISMEDTSKRCYEHDYKEVLPTDYFLTGKLNDEFKVEVECVDPDEIIYSANDSKTALFKITSTFLRARKPQSITFTHSRNIIPNDVEWLKIKYSLETLTPETHLVKCPIEIKERGPSSVGPDLQVNFRKENAGFKAESGGTIQAGNGKIDTHISG